MNHEKHVEYLTLKTEIKKLLENRFEINQRIENYKNQIIERQAQIQTIAATLEKEDRAIASGSRLHQPTLTIDQYNDQKNTLEALKAELPAIEQSITDTNRELAILDAELQEKRRAVTDARDLLLVDLAEQSLNEFAAAAGESFKKLVMAVIAVEGRGKGFNHGQKAAFTSETYRIICEEIIPAVFADTKELPDLPECNQFVDDLIEKTA